MNYRLTPQRQAEIDALYAKYQAIAERCDGRDIGRHWDLWREHDALRRRMESAFAAQDAAAAAWAARVEWLGPYTDTEGKAFV